MKQQAPPRPRSYVRIALRLGVIIAFAYGVHLALDWLQYRIEIEDSTGSRALLSGVVFLILLVYALLIAVPFVPGVEIGVSLLALQGASIAPLVYLFTLLGLSLSFYVGRQVPLRVVQHGLGELGLAKFSAAIGDLDRLSPQDRLDSLRNKLPAPLRRIMAPGRYMLLAVLINIPGNAVIGGGGGICLIAGLSRIFSPGWALLTLALAVAPVPLGIYFMWPGFGPGEI